MSEKSLEKLFERIKFLRDKQRFYEGFTAIVFGLYGLGVSLKDPIYRVITFGIAMVLAIYAAYRHKYLLRRSLASYGVRL